MEKTGDFLQKIENFVDLYDCQTVAFVVLSAALLLKLSILTFFTFIQSHSQRITIITEPRRSLQVCFSWNTK